MKTIKDIQSTLSVNRARLFSSYPLKSIAIFGSYSRNEQDATSDIDIMVEFRDEIGIRFIDLAEDLEKSLGVKVDLVSKKGIKEKYLQSIEQDLIYV